MSFSHLNTTRMSAVRAVQRGASMQFVARSEGVAYSTVQRWCEQFGVRTKHRPRHDQHMVAQCLTEVASGQAIKHTARRHRVAASTVLRWCRAHGVASRHAYTRAAA